MCGIAGIISLDGRPIANLDAKLRAMSRLIAHRGPDGSGRYVGAGGRIGLAHRRLSVIDVSDAAQQPMVGENKAALVFNGEIYNYLELRRALAAHWTFRSHSDTETILAAHAHQGVDCLASLRGMFSFALWDGEELFCARDRFGIKPFFYTIGNGFLAFASEAKALMPLLPEIDTDGEAFAEWATFQFTLGDQTLFKGIRALMPGHRMRVRDGRIEVTRYWDVSYQVDQDHNAHWFHRRLRDLLEDSLRDHLRSDVQIGGYLSGGIDSSLIAMMAGKDGGMPAFHGKFTDHPGYDESGFARIAAAGCGAALHERVITATDFVENIGKVIYHLDFPVAGPGSFPQYMVSEMASRHVKVVLGGQGGDEIFGGYARYVIAYFEQCIKAAIEGTYKNGHFVVTAESIIPNLTVLAEYKPLIRKFWSQGVFGPLEERYFRLVNRAVEMKDEFNWSQIDQHRVYEDFKKIFNSEENCGKRAYFDKMTHFDFKTLLPALLHVEDRMSMAHGLEARVPFLDHRLVELMATVPADVKFKDGRMKHMLKEVFGDVLPDTVLNRRDKMGFPVPLTEWSADEPVGPFIRDVIGSMRSRHRPFVNGAAVADNFASGEKFSRKVWGLLSLELWHQAFHDRAAEYRGMIDAAADPDAEDFAQSPRVGYSEASARVGQAPSSGGVSGVLAERNRASEGGRP